MARIRSIKPEFWSSEQVMALSRDARLLFIGMWNFADDAGRLKLNAATLKAQVFPGDSDVSASHVAEWIEELIHGGLIERYVNVHGTFSEITGWSKHQKINRPQPSKFPGKHDYSPIHGSFTDRSVNDHGVFTDGSDKDLSTEGIGGEAPAASPAPVPPLPPAPPMRTPNGVVWVRFKARVVAATGMPPGSTDKTTQAAKSLADWLGQQATDEADFERRLAVVLDAFFADDWAASKGWPIAALASNPVRYAKTPSSPLGGAGNGLPASGQETPDEKRARLKRELAAANGRPV